MTATRAPDGLEARGRRFWRRVVDVYELSESEVELLAEVCRSLDVCERLDRVARRCRRDRDVGGELSAVRELRLQRGTLGRLLAQLGLPDEDGEVLESPASARARKGANAMWAGVSRLRSAAEDGGDDGAS